MSMKIYFCGSILGGRDDGELYARLIQRLEKYGEVLTKIVASPTVGEEDKKLKGDQFKQIHDQDLGWLMECDCVIAEVTQQSLGVGYEIGRAVDLKKPILCLFRPNSGKYLSAMIQGAENGTSFIVKHYKESESESIFHDFFKSLALKN